MIFNTFIVGFLFAITPTIKSNILLHEIKKEEIILYSNIISTLFIFLLNKKFIVQKEIIYNYKLLILLVSLSVISYTYNNILSDLFSKFDSSKVMILIKCFETIFLLVLSNSKITFKKIIAVLLIIIGSILYL